MNVPRRSSILTMPIRPLPVRSAATATRMVALGGRTECASSGDRRPKARRMCDFSVAGLSSCTRLRPRSLSLRLTKNRTLTPLTAKGHRIVGQAIAKQANPQPSARLRPSGPFLTDDRRRGHRWGAIRSGNVRDKSTQAFPGADHHRRFLIIDRTRIRMAAQLEVGARPALVFMTDVARAHVARQHEDFNRSMKGRCFAPGHDCTSETPQYYTRPALMRGRSNSRRTDLSSGAVRVRLRPSGRVAAPH